MAIWLQWLTRRTGPPLRHGHVQLVEPCRRHYEAWAVLRETSRHHLEPFEPAWAANELSAASYRRRLRRYRSDRRLGTGAAFLIERASDNVLLGGVTLTNLRRGVTQSASVGYWIGLPYVRQGYASDALSAMLHHAFGALELNRIEAACMPSNRASLAVLERAGFRREGIARRYLKINGIFQDHVVLARLRDDPPVAAVAPAAYAIDTTSARAGVVSTRAASGAGTASEPQPSTAAGAAAEGRAA